MAGRHHRIPALYEDEPLRPLEEITANAEAVRMIVGGVALASSAAELLPQPASDDEQNDAVSEGDGFSVVELSGELLEVGGHPGQFACGL